MGSENTHYFLNRVVNVPKCKITREKIKTRKNFNLLSINYWYWYILNVNFYCKHHSIIQDKKKWKIALQVLFITINEICNCMWSAQMYIHSRCDETSWTKTNTSKRHKCLMVYVLLAANIIWICPGMIETSSSNSLRKLSTYYLMRC